MEYRLRQCEKNDFDLIFTLKKLCMKWYIEMIYGWNEEIQIKKTHNEIEKNINNMKIIAVDNKDIGVTIFTKNDDCYCVGLIMIHPHYQNNGIASSIISDYIHIAKKDNKKIIIKTFKENPARRLYERLGFKAYCEDETHIHLQIDFSK